MKKINPTTVAALRKAKIINEFTMVKELRKLFETRAELYQPANRVARLAVEILAAINRERVTLGDAICRQVMATYIKEFALTILTDQSSKLLDIKKEVEQLEQKPRTTAIDKADFEKQQKVIIAKFFVHAEQAIGKLQAQKPVGGFGAYNALQIGEIIRLFAGVCESINPDLKKDSTANLAKDITLRLSGIRANAPAETVVFNFGDYCGLRAIYRNSPWGSKAFDKEARDRGPRSPAEIKRYGTDNNSVEAAVLNVLDLKPGLSSGNTLFVLGDKDVVGTINRSLGLLNGADISGTTCDTIWALESLMQWLQHFDSSFVVNPNLLLLPVAAIVSGFHHTVLEVGLALSINYDTGALRIAYAPGFFTTLQNDDMRKHDKEQAIGKLLQAAEQHADNAILLGAEDSNGQAVVYRAEPSEREAVKAALQLTAAKYDIWHSLAQRRPAPVSVVDIKKIYPTLVD